MTGDLGRMDEDSYVYITDRIKDIIIRDGYNVVSAIGVCYNLSVISEYVGFCFRRERALYRTGCIGSSRSWRS